MPYACRTHNIEIDPKLTGGKVTVMPWCLEHNRWYFLCQTRLPQTPQPAAESQCKMEKDQTC